MRNFGLVLLISSYHSKGKYFNISSAKEIFHSIYKGLENYEKYKKINFIKKFFEFIHKYNDLKQDFVILNEELRNL